MVPAWMFVLVCALSTLLLGTTLILYHRARLPFPIPVPDRGHRCFPVPNEAVAEIIAGILAQHGLAEQFTFSSGGTNQCVVGGDTVLFWCNEQLRSMGLDKSVLSVPVQDPVKAAHQAKDALWAAGFEVKVHDALPGMERKLVVVEIAELDWLLVFRRHLLRMGRPLQMRTITGELVTV